MTSSPSKDLKETTNPDFKFPPKYKFAEGEKVLCFHGPLIYVAKCLQTRYDDKIKVPEYHIHYSGWNKSWDEWVPESRVLKYNDANLQKQKELCQAQENEPKIRKPKKKSIGTESVDSPDSRSSTPVNEKDREKDKEKTSLSKMVQTGGSLGQSSSSTPDDISEGTKSRESAADSTEETDDDSISDMDLGVDLSDELKEWLVEDWDQITRQGKLLNLPATTSVDQILEEYFNTKLTCPSNSAYESTITEVLDGIRSYFNDLIESQLLYENERKQYAEMQTLYPDTSMSKIYGAMHLLRLLVKLGGILAATTIDDKFIDMILMHVQEFVDYLDENAESLISVEDYEEPCEDL